MSFISLYTAYSGLQAAQAAMDTASHNVANAATPGYTRQRVELATRLPAEPSFGPVGTGVSITDISRVRDDLLDARARGAAGAAAHYTTLGNLLSGIEAPLGEPDNGVTAALGGLWSSLEELSLNPPDLAARSQVLTSLESVAARVRSVAAAWQQTSAQVAGETEAAVGEFNALLHDVASLNESILQAGGDAFPPNDLLDKRDIALDRLTQLAGVTVTVTDRGAARVSLNGLGLVHDTIASPLAFDTGTQQLTHSSGAAVAAGGSIGAQQAFLTQTLPTNQAGLDQFAADLADALNAQHNAGFAPNGTPGGALLSYNPASAALTIAVALTDPAGIAAAASGPPVAEFDGLNIEALFALRTQATASGGTQTLDAAMRAVVGSVGGATASAFAEANSQTALAAAAESSRSQMHGVSIDEEMVSLLTSQRAYEAAARVMTAVDQNLDTLINRTGVVGR